MEEPFPGGARGRTSLLAWSFTSVNLRISALVAVNALYPLYQGAHTPATQLGVALGQTRPQPPQFCGSDWVDLHPVVGQQVWPVTQAAWPALDRHEHFVLALQVSPGLQLAPDPFPHLQLPFPVLQVPLPQSLATHLQAPPRQALKPKALQLLPHPLQLSGSVVGSTSQSLAFASQSSRVAGLHWYSHLLAMHDAVAVAAGAQALPQSLQ